MPKVVFCGGDVVEVPVQPESLVGVVANLEKVEFLVGLHYPINLILSLESYGG